MRITPGLPRHARWHTSLRANFDCGRHMEHMRQALFCTGALAYKSQIALILLIFGITSPIVVALVVVPVLVREIGL